MTQPIAILGTGGNCVDILDLLLDANDARGAAAYECIGFLDDDESRYGMSIRGVPVVGPLASAPTLGECWFVNGIGSPGNFWRKPEIIASTRVPDHRFATLVHPTASVSRMATLGAGCVVLQHVTIASNVRIGRHVMILPNSIVSHDDEIGDYSSLGGGVAVSGGVSIGDRCYLGSNATIIGNIRIGDDSLVGMGSTVLRDVPPNSVVAGNPARYLRPTR